MSRIKIKQDKNILIYNILYIMDLSNIIPAKLYEVIERANITTTKQIITLSVWDIKKLTHLNNDDILLLKHIVSQNCFIAVITGNELQEDSKRVQMGCTTIDMLLNGGFRRGTLTEIYGESGTGKTQIAIQAAAFAHTDGSVFICTEDSFPIKRYNQVCQSIFNKTQFGENLFIEHQKEPQQLLSCIRIRLPKLLDKNKISLIVIDSIAAPFRCEHTNYIQRAEELKEIGFSLLNLAQKYNFAVICINQVTSSFDDSDDVIPTLGLVWSNMVSYKIKLTKTNEVCKKNSNEFNIRKLTLMSSPESASAEVKYIIMEKGIEEV